MRNKKRGNFEKKRKNRTVPHQPVFAFLASKTPDASVIPNVFPHSLRGSERLMYVALITNIFFFFFFIFIFCFPFFPDWDGLRSTLRKLRVCVGVCVRGCGNVWDIFCVRRRVCAVFVFVCACVHFLCVYASNKYVCMCSCLNMIECI